MGRVLAHQFFRVLTLCLALGWAGLLASPVLASDDELCRNHFGKKQYLRAARCFQDVAGKLEAKKSLKPYDRSLLFQHIRNASLSFRREASRTTSHVRAAYLREQALFLVRKILRRKYYQMSAQKRVARLLKERLEEKIGYCQVVVTTAAKKASVQILGGYRFPSQTSRGASVTFRLRPGTYTVIATYHQQPAQAHSITVKPGQTSLLVKFQPKRAKQKTQSRKAKARKIAQRRPPSKVPPAGRRPAEPPPAPRKASPAPWILVGLGVAAIAAGGIMAGVGFRINQTNNDKANDLQAQKPISAEDAGQIVGGHNNASTLWTSGWIMGSVGIVASIVGGVLYAVNSMPTKQPGPSLPQNSASKTAQSRQLFHGQ